MWVGALNLSGHDDGAAITAIASLLRDNGADIESRDVGGSTPLSWAVFFERGNFAVPLLLQAGADVNAADQAGYTPLLLARWGSRAVTEQLLDHGADIEHKDHAGRTALSHTASYDGKLELVEVLLERGAECQLDR